MCDCDWRPVQEPEREFLERVRLVQPTERLRELREKEQLRELELALRVQQALSVHAHFAHQDLLVAL